MKKRFNINKHETIMPIKSHKFDAGYDIYMPQTIAIQPFETLSIDLKVKVTLAENECGIICMRSSLAKEGLIAHTSPIDYGYTGNIHLIVTNCSPKKKYFDCGERYCQLVIFKIPIEEDEELYIDRLR